MVWNVKGGRRVVAHRGLDRVATDDRGGTRIDMGEEACLGSGGRRAGMSGKRRTEGEVHTVQSDDAGVCKRCDVDGAGMASPDATAGGVTRRRTCHQGQGKDATSRHALHLGGRGSTTPASCRGRATPLLLLLTTTGSSTASCTTGTTTTSTTTTTTGCAVVTTTTPRRR